MKYVIKKGDKYWTLGAWTNKQSKAYEWDVAHYGDQYFLEDGERWVKIVPKKKPVKWGVQYIDPRHIHHKRFCGVGEDGGEAWVVLKSDAQTWTQDEKDEACDGFLHQGEQWVQL